MIVYETDRTIQIVNFKSTGLVALCSEVADYVKSGDAAQDSVDLRSARFAEDERYLKVVFTTEGKPAPSGTDSPTQAPAVPVTMKGYRDEDFREFPGGMVEAMAWLGENRPALTRPNAFRHESERYVQFGSGDCWVVLSW